MASLMQSSSENSRLIRETKRVPVLIPSNPGATLPRTPEKQGETCRKKAAWLSPTHATVDEKREVSKVPGSSDSTCLPQKEDMGKREPAEVRKTAESEKKQKSVKRISGSNGQYSSTFEAHFSQNLPWIFLLTPLRRFLVERNSGPCVSQFEVRRQGGCNPQRRTVNNNERKEKLHERRCGEATFSILSDVVCAKEKARGVRYTYPIHEKLTLNTDEDEVDHSRRSAFRLSWLLFLLSFKKLN
ncbi:hypothetical protein TGME49_227040 [Toxoplasma gondii ME49]|uniref:Uncharacterized protein n=1 Tax=Toxoplasma gondii (strain ATCC 50611 / Me49) TaxID=508771 RepID=S8GFI9_TOXGM|nr:hypothetical protein TGME49_227040 [Toxoplasma gondii ME49]EPT27204.1 hypothetical protein TGME49_227040 [Toxoplasma gondii ME49]|eukprot:XP_002366357.1 hypothetical protein TGME49_227040 [Toxoplasma gondii ME49]